MLPHICRKTGRVGPARPMPYKTFVLFLRSALMHVGVSAEAAKALSAQCMNCTSAVNLLPDSLDTVYSTPRSHQGGGGGGGRRGAGGGSCGAGGDAGAGGAGGSTLKTPMTRSVTALYCTPLGGSSTSKHSLELGVYIHPLHSSES